ncbi:MAG: N-acetylmuramoyl-L-alanine amidase, partial [Candidatus Limnocylindria bacterium]|nr:N-acetylmuramoyl-L-alanine amidase [Candidatus Limnocylindria bacterium]
AGSTGGETLLFSSDTIDADQTFDRLGVHWVAARGAEATLYVEVRTSANGAAWADWRSAVEDEDMTNEYTNEHYAAPRPVDAARFAQYRVWLTNGDPDAIARVNLTFLDVSDLNAGPVARLFNDIAGAFSDFTRGYADAAPVGSSRILTRQDWGADESLMQWPPRYQKVQKFVIHHTVTDDGGTNVAATIRSMYYYHAVTRGWGDIGYNYLVDKFGNIWIGRQGGDNVIAGHAYGWNNGSIGIAAIGNYSVAQPTSALQGAIANIIAMKSTQFGIQPYGNETFTHQEQAPDGSWVNVTSNPTNVLGHRDCNYILSQYGGQTACPGNGIYNMLDGLRRLAQNAVLAGYVDMPYIDPQLPKAGFPGAALTVPVTITNRGQSAIPAGTNVSYRLLKNGAIYVAQGGSATLPAQVTPGQSAVVTVPFAVPALGSYVARWDLQTGGTWWNTTKNTPVRDVWFNSADWSADWIKDNVPISWVAGETKQISVTVQNDGGRVWPATGLNPVRLGYKWVSNATGNTFPGASRVSLPSDVAPGQIVTLTIPVVAPVYPTNYTMYLDLYKENEFAFADRGIAPDDTPTGVSVDFKATYVVPSTPTFNAGQTATVPVTITNAGKGTFPTTSSYPVNLGYHWYDTSGKAVLWDGGRTKLPADLLAGQSAQLQAQVTAPPQGGQYQLRFDLVQEGVSWFTQKGVPSGNVTLNVNGPVVPAYGATYQVGVSTLGVTGALATVPVTVTNTSNFSWSSAATNPINLGYHWYDANGAAVVWDGMRTKLAGAVGPGQSQTVQASLQFPSAPGSYSLRLDLVQEGVAWFSQKGVPTGNVGATVSPPAQSTGFGATYDVSRAPLTLPTEIRSNVSVTLTNTSTFAWSSSGANPINLSYHWYDTTGNQVVWDGWRTSLNIPAGQSAVVNAVVAGPPRAGTFVLRFDLVQEGITWFSQKGVAMPATTITTAVPPYGAAFTSAPVSVSGGPGTAILVPLTIKNTGSLTWDPTQAFDVSYHITTWSDVVSVWDGLRTALPSSVAPGQSVTLNVGVRTPASAGSYVIKFEVVREGVSWFSGQGVPTGNVALEAR